jgi:hypothetical protein
VKELGGAAEQRQADNLSHAETRSSVPENS